MTKFQRFSVYVLPDPPLADVGAAWLGWDNAAGRPAEHPRFENLDVASVTAIPRKYGLHGTIKPPFFLPPGRSPDDLQQAFAELCSQLPPVSTERLELRSMGSFLALAPLGSTAALASLAAHVVQELDQFRAPPTDEELARRNPDKLSPTQLNNLQRWGYPYVMDAFRFHITLTGPLNKSLRERTKAILRPLFEPTLSDPFTVNNLSLCGQDEHGMFHQIDRKTLTG